MKKLTIFYVFLIISTSISATNWYDKSAGIAQFFREQLHFKLNDGKIEQEFNGWAIMDDGKPVYQLFQEEMDYSSDLKNMVDYFDCQVNEMYAKGIQGGYLTEEICTSRIIDNVDIIINMFRNSLVKHGTVIQETIDLRKKYGAFNTDLVNSGVQIPNVNEQQLMLDCEEPIVNEPTVDPIQEIKVPGKETQIPTMVDFKKERPGAKSSKDAFEVWNNVFIKKNVSTDPFHDKLENAINAIPKDGVDYRAFRTITVALLGTDKPTEQKLIDLNNKLDAYLDARTLEEKPYAQLTAWEKMLYNSPFEWIRNKTRSKMAKSRINKEDLSWVIVALNIKNFVVKKLFHINIKLKKHKLVRKYFDELQRSIKLALCLK